MKAYFLFYCVGCTKNELELIESYESSVYDLEDATVNQKKAIEQASSFTNKDLFEDYNVKVKQFPYQNQELICVEWSAIHHFYRIEE